MDTLGGLGAESLVTHLYRCPSVTPRPPRLDKHQAECFSLLLGSSQLRYLCGYADSCWRSPKDALEVCFRPCLRSVEGDCGLQLRLHCWPGAEWACNAMLPVNSVFYELTQSTLHWKTQTAIKNMEETFVLVGLLEELHPTLR